MSAFGWPPQVDGRFAIRACIVNHGMTAVDIDAIITDIRSRARAVSGGPGSG